MVACGAPKPCDLRALTVGGPVLAGGLLGGRDSTRRHQDPRPLRYLPTLAGIMMMTMVGQEQQQDEE